MKNLTLAEMQVLENSGIVFGDHVKGIVSKNEDFQIYDTKKGRFVPANEFRTDIPLKNYKGYVLN